MMKVLVSKMYCLTCIALGTMRFELILVCTVQIDTIGRNESTASQSPK